MITLLDNRDSFTFNLAQELQRLGAEVVVVRSSETTADEVYGAGPRGILVGPGPGQPAGAGCSEEVIRRAAGDPGAPPLLGVCLGLQALATALGGTLRRATNLVHGETRDVTHDGTGPWTGLASPLPIARYNSLAVDEATLPAALRVNARTGDGDIAGLVHASGRISGVQGHPESILCVAGGAQLLENFLATCS